jgi:multicomponent Na+:H+ antiporter subunit B
VSPTATELVLLLFVLVAALGAAMLKDLLASIMAFAAYSLGISIIWVVLQAPDVGLTEAAVGAGVMTLLFLLAIANTARPAEEKLFERPSPAAVIVAGLFVIVMLATVPSLPAIGSPDAPVIAGEVTQEYVQNAYEKTEVHNAVTAVLAGYRGLDTLGEAVVVFTAGIATLAVLRREVFT